MADDDIERLNGRLIDDPELRDRFRKDPAGVVREAGIELNSEQEGRLAVEGWLDKAEDELIALLHDLGLRHWF